MNDLKHVLTEISEGADKAGGTVSRRARVALRAHRKQRFDISIVLASVVLICLAYSAYLLAEKGTQAAQSFAMLAGIGGTGASFEVLRRVWKDYTQTDLLLILIEDANEAQVMALISRLLKSL